MNTGTDEACKGREGRNTRIGHCKQDEYDEYIGRNSSQGSMNEVPTGQRGWLGNPYPEGQYGRERCIELFRADFEERLAEDAEFREAVAELAGQTLGCWCRSVEENEPACHGDVIAEYAERLAQNNG